jgi:hypothetical protein
VSVRNRDKEAVVAAEPDTAQRVQDGRAETVELDDSSQAVSRYSRGDSQENREKGTIHMATLL